jgi:hypothetical protein
MVINTSSSYCIGGSGVARPTYLPGGNWADLNARNHLPGQCEGFVFLEVTADFSNIDGDPEKTVYVPCYWKG